MNCPVCSSEMSRRSSYDVEIDMCAQHGIWLEKGELARILDSFAEQALPVSGSVEDARHRGRLEGVFGGFLSLFLPK